MHLQVHHGQCYLPRFSEINLVATLADFFLAEESPLDEKDVRIKPRKKMGNSMTHPDFKLVLSTLAELWLPARCCWVPSTRVCAVIYSPRRGVDCSS